MEITSLQQLLLATLVLFLNLNFLIKVIFLPFVSHLFIKFVNSVKFAPHSINLLLPFLLTLLYHPNLTIVILFSLDFLTCQFIVFNSSKILSLVSSFLLPENHIISLQFFANFTGYLFLNVSNSKLLLSPLKSNFINSLLTSLI